MMPVWDLNDIGVLFGLIVAAIGLLGFAWNLRALYQERFLDQGMRLVLHNPFKEKP